jgi:ABC-type branched-subunit amino acid transport system substrate-binding protein
MIRKAVLLFLVALLLPACAQLPGFPLGAPAPAVQQTEDTLFREAEASYRRHAYRQALQQYGAVLERYPQGGHATAARLREAELLGLLGDWQGSLRRYQSLLARQPEPAVALQARYGVGRAHFKLGQYQQATQVLDSLTAGDLPRSLWFSTQALLSEIALKQGQVSQAFSRLRLAAQDLPAGDQEWFEDLKTRVVEAATPPELEHLATLYRDSPLSAALLLRLGRLAQEGGRTKEARQWVTTLKERFPNSPEAVAAERLLAGNKLLVGSLLPLSGQLSNVGFRVQRGMELAAKGTPLELVFRDTHSDPGSVPALIQELGRDERVAAILGPLTSAAAQVAAETAQAAGVPLIALSQKEGLTQTGSSIFQAFLTPRQQVRALVRRTLAQGLKRFAVIYPDSNYGRTFQQLFQDELAAQGGGEVWLQSFYASGTQEFAPLVATIQDALTTHPEDQTGLAIFIPDDPAAVAAIASSLANTKLQGVQLLGTNLLHNPAIPEAQRRALEGILFPDAFFAGDPDSGVQKFLTAYKQQYGENPDYLAAQGYMVVRVMARLAESQPSLSRADLPRLLLSLKGVPELPWFQGFNPEREEEAAIYLLTIKGGAFQMVGAGASRP